MYCKDYGGHTFIFHYLSKILLLCCFVLFNIYFLNNVYVNHPLPRWSVNNLNKNIA